ncbi:hypothetical protein HN385_07990 [archaeon]|jgi:hypothetical protein|nr:hypothetical protein [archaeon]
MGIREQLQQLNETESFDEGWIPEWARKTGSNVKKFFSPKEPMKDGDMPMQPGAQDGRAMGGETSKDTINQSKINKKYKENSSAGKKVEFKEPTKPTEGPLKSKAPKVPKEPSLLDKSTKFATDTYKSGKEYAKKGVEYAKEKPWNVAGGAAAAAAIGLGAYALRKRMRAKKKAAAKKK